MSYVGVSSSNHMLECLTIHQPSMVHMLSGWAASLLGLLLWTAQWRQILCSFSGQRRDASKQQVEHMNTQLSILQAITSNFVHRVGREQLIKDLPAKHEHVVLLRLSPAQERMYAAYLEVGHTSYPHYEHSMRASKLCVQPPCRLPADAYTHGA